MKIDIDVSAIDKGRVFTPAELEEMLGTSQRHRSYAMVITAFASWLETQLRKAGKPLVVCTRRDSVCVLDHAEATVYTARRYKLDRKRAARNVKRAEAIPVDELTVQDRERHERNLIWMVREQSALKDTRRELRALYSRETV